MKATTYRIVSRRRWFPEALASSADFRLVRGSDTDAAEVLRNPDVSMYCLDHRRRQVLFVETPPGTDLTAAAFLYGAQFEHARQVIAVDYAAVCRLAAGVQVRCENLTFLYSVGRAGSTLLCKMFERDPDTIALSEPDIFARFVPLLADEPQDRDELEALLSACTRILLAGSITGTRRHVLIKLRGFCIELAEPLARAFPEARILFLYRNAVPVIESFIRGFTGGRLFHLVKDLWPARKLMQVLARANRRSINRFLPHVTMRHIDRIATTGLAGGLCAAWMSIMKTYCELYERRPDAVALLYEDITDHPREIISALFDFCGVAQTSVDAALHAMQHDSQAGTRLGRATAYKKNAYLKKVDPAHVQLMLQAEPGVDSADFVVPGTLRPQTAVPGNDPSPPAA